jgi:hypothetical protein
MRRANTTTTKQLHAPAPIRSTARKFPRPKNEEEEEKEGSEFLLWATVRV